MKDMQYHPLWQSQPRAEALDQDWSLTITRHAIGYLPSQVVFHRRSSSIKLCSCAKFQACSLLPSGRFWCGSRFPWLSQGSRGYPRVPAVFRVTGGKQSQLLVLGLSLEFDKKHRKQEAAHNINQNSCKKNPPSNKNSTSRKKYPQQFMGNNNVVMKPRCYRKPRYGIVSRSSCYVATRPVIGQNQHHGNTNYSFVLKI